MAMDILSHLSVLFKACVRVSECLVNNSLISLVCIERIEPAFDSKIMHGLSGSFHNAIVIGAVDILNLFTSSLKVSGELLSL